MEILSPATIRKATSIKSSNRFEPKKNEELPHLLTSSEKCKNIISSKHSLSICVGPTAITGRSDPGPVFAEPRISSRGQVKMEGYLEKKGKMRLVSTWKRHWFVLDGRLLLYFKSQQEYARLSPCRGSLNMGLAACVRPGCQHGRNDEGLLLQVVLRAHVVTLRAKDRVSHERWLQALLDCITIPRAPSPNHEQKLKHPLHLRYPSADNLSQSQNADLEKRSKHRTLPAWRRSASNAADWRPLGGVTDRLRTLRVYPLSQTPMENTSRSQSPSVSPTPTPPPPPENGQLIRHQLAYEENESEVTRSSEELGRCGVNGHARQRKNLMNRDENQNQPRLKATLLQKAQSQHKGSCPEELSSWVRNRNGNGGNIEPDYVKHSDSEDCDRRERHQTRKPRSEKIEETSTDNADGSRRRKHPLRSRLSFLAKVLSTVRRHSSHISKETVDEVLQSNGHPKEIEDNMVTSIEESSPVPIEMNGHRTDMFNMPPIEPPPDYDSVSPETEGASPSDHQTRSSPPKSCSVPDLPPRQVRRPRSPWHDVPTNNSPVYVPTDEEDLDDRHHHLVGVQRSRDRNIPHPIPHEISHPQWSPGASSDHLAIFLSSESSDDDFHEDQVVLRRSLDLPNADPQGHVGLSRIEAAKLSLLLRAHEAGSASHRQRPERDDVCGDVDAIIARLEASSASVMQSPFKPPLPEKRPVLRAQSFHVVPISSSFCHEKRSTPDLRPHIENEIVVHEQSRPPALPAKARRSATAHSKELDALLAQLTDMTQVPLRPAAGTRSLEERSICESDYDVPRPHSSFLQLIAQRSSPTKNGIPVSNSSSIRGIPPGGTMSPDSLDHPGPCGAHAVSAFTSPHRPHTWDAIISSTPATSAKKLRDRNRRATLSGPIADYPEVVPRDVWQRIPPPYVPAPIPPTDLSASLEDISERLEYEAKPDLEVDSLEVAARCDVDIDVPVGMLVCIAEEPTEESERSGLSVSASVSVSPSDGALRCAANTNSRGLAASDSDLMVSDEELGSPDHTLPHLQPDSLYCGGFGSIEEDSLEPKQC